MLMVGGYIHPALPAASTEATDRLNAELVRLNRSGEAIGCLSAPALGAGIVVPVAEILAFGALQDGVPADPARLGAALKDALGRSGRSVARNEPAAPPASAPGGPAAQAETVEPEAELARALLAHRLPALQRLCTASRLDLS